MPRFEIHTRLQNSDQWYIDDPIDPTWVRSELMAIAQARVSIQRARKRGEVLVARVVVVPKVGKKRIVWRSEWDR